MVGFDDLLFQLLDLLTGHPSTRRVISIVGTGGAGKTTLAQNAFENPLIVQHFDVCLWATISQQYVVQDILLTLLSRKRESSSEAVCELGEQLCKMLYGRRYLIVLDDMWSVRAWDVMKSLFPDTSNGSRIVVTTRQSDVGDNIGSLPLVVSLLGDDKSWDLFCEKVFAGEGCPPELEDVGKNIVRKCGGLPLAIVVVAGHFGKSSRTQECWENVANNMKSVLNSNETKQLFKILSFSYIHLPVHLKPCFVYMGTFPEDKRIFISDLIRRWIAEGFVKSYNAENLEENAEDYLKDLIDRNLILDYTQKTSGDSYCKIYDLLRELCLKVAEKEMFFNIVDGGRAICRERRVANKEKNREENHHPQVFHTPRSVQEWRTGDELLFDLRLCRLLFAGEVEEGFLETDQYFNLRYLDHCKIYQSFDISSSISLFWNLQTLIIGKYHPSVLSAPDEIWDMIQLRHLEVRSGIHLPDPLLSDKLDQANALVMRNLHTLLGVYNFKLSEEICKRVPNIKELNVNFIDEVKSYYCPHNLVRLCKLESLELYIISEDSRWREYGLNLTFPSSLKKLYLRYTCLGWEEMTMMIGSLPHLQTLYLYKNSVIGSEWSLVDGKFLGLKSLTIYDCHDLVNWNADSSHFPVLESLTLWNVSRLDEFPSDIGAIPTLRCITLRWCSVPLAISAVRMLVEQEVEHGNEGLQLHVYFKNLAEKETMESFNEKMEEEGLIPNNLYLRGGLWQAQSA